MDLSIILKIMFQDFIRELFSKKTLVMVIALFVVAAMAEPVNSIYQSYQDAAKQPPLPQVERSYPTPAQHTPDASEPPRRSKLEEIECLNPYKMLSLGCLE